MKGKKKKIRIADIIRIIILLIALSVLLYPTVSNYLYEKNSSRVTSSYDDTLEKMTEQELEALRQEAYEYNKNLVQSGVSVTDPFGEDSSRNEEYENILNIEGNGMMGYIRIPKIDVELPIYHGTSEPVLQVGVGHLASSSLPVGGETTHTVLTGHRGLPSKLLSTDLDQMVEGDIFYLKVLGETLAYEVDQILTVLPEEMDALGIEEGKDYATLVTCTPYAVNTHRLLIRGHRIPYEEAVEKEADEVSHGLKIPFEVLVLLIAIGVLVLLFILWRIIRKLREKKERPPAGMGSGRQNKKNRADRACRTRRPECRRTAPGRRRRKRKKQ